MRMISGTTFSQAAGIGQMRGRQLAVQFDGHTKAVVTVHETRGHQNVIETHAYPSISASARSRSSTRVKRDTVSRNTRSDGLARRRLVILGPMGSTALAAVA